MPECNFLIKSPMLCLLEQVRPKEQRNVTWAGQPGMYPRL